MSAFTTNDKVVPSSCTKHDYALDPQLLHLLADSSEEAFKTIYRRHRQKVFGVALRYLKSEDFAKEVLQEVFMKLWQKRCHIKADTAIEGWLYMVAKNNTLNRLKKTVSVVKGVRYLRQLHSEIDDSTGDNIAAAEMSRLIKRLLISFLLISKKYI